MSEKWILLNAIPAEGQNLSFTDEAIWTEPIAEFALPYTLTEGAHAELFLLRQEDGILIRGNISAEVTMPCTRCLEDAKVLVSHSFDSFEPIPQVADGENFEQEDETNIALAPNDAGLGLEIYQILWEEFLLSLPVKPLCSETCKGLCPYCGTNLNNSSCSCAEEQIDPRMAALRNVKITKQ